MRLRGRSVVRQALQPSKPPAPEVSPPPANCVRSSFRSLRPSTADAAVGPTSVTRLSTPGHGPATPGGACGSSESKMRIDVGASANTAAALLLHIFILVGFLVITVPAQPTIPSGQLWRQLRPPNPIPYNLESKRNCLNACKDEPYDPVCGNDMKTYVNKCMIRFQRFCLQRSRLEVYHKGKCNKNRRLRRRTCKNKRKEMLQLFDESPSKAKKRKLYIPVCREDGTFKKIQCHPNKGICFCVDKRTGKQQPGTISRLPKRPICAGGGRKKKSRVDKCSPGLRKQFNENLIRQFQIEFDRVVDRRQRQRVNAPVKRNTAIFPVGLLLTGEQGYTLNSTELRVVEWKFSELDLNYDNTLSFRELRSLRRVVRRFMRPRACARRFAKRCDTNRNRRIERSEWSVCMGISTATFIPERRTEKVNRQERRRPPTSIMTLVTMKRTDKQHIRYPLNRGQVGVNGRRSSAFHRPQTCAEARREAIQKNSENPRIKVFVPQCSPQGTYKRQQCWPIDNGEKLCFCMDPITGEVVKGASDCRHVKPKRQFKGCPSNRKKRFLTELMDRIIEETQGRWGSRHGPEMPSTSKTSIEERALRWKFFLLDVNRNQKLDKKEMRKFKNEIKQRIQGSKRQVARELRKCARNFLRYCNANGDRYITLKELIQCTDVRKKNTSSRSSRLDFLLRTN